MNRHPIDLIEMRQQITALRSRHSENLSITQLLNKFLVKIVFLDEPESAAHAQRLREMFARTLADVDRIVRSKSSGKAND